MAAVPLLLVDEEESPVAAMVGTPSLGKDEVTDVSVSRLREVVGCEEMVVVGVLSVSMEWLFELEEVVEIPEGLKVTAVTKSVVAVMVVPEMSEDGCVGVTMSVDVSVTETEVVLAGIEYVVGRLGKVT